MRKKKKKTYLKNDAYSSDPEEKRREQQQLEPGLLLVAVGFSRLSLGRSLSGSRSGGDLDVVELARLLCAWEGTALACHMADLTTAKAPLLGNKIGLVFRGEFGRARGVVGVAVVAGQIVDLSGKVVDGNMEIVNIHSIRIVLGRNGGAVRIEDRVNQAGLGDSGFQGGTLSELDLFAGVTLKTLDIPMQSGTFVKGRDTAEQTTEFMSVESNRSFALLERLKSLAGSSDGIGRGVEGEEVGLEFVPGGVDSQARGAPPRFGVIS